MERLIYQRMLIPWTMAALALLTAIMVLVRILWLHVPAGLRWFLIRAAIAVIFLQAIFTVTKWGTTSHYANIIINWLAIAGYELLVLLFSRLSPRWVTSISAAILIVPLFASAILLPLTGIFAPGSIKKTFIGRHLYYKIAPWSNSGAGNAGVDVDIYYRPVFAPFISHKIQTQPFNTMECNAYATLVVPGPEPKTVLLRCPHWPAQPAGTVDKILYVGTM